MRVLNLIVFGAGWGALVVVGSQCIGWVIKAALIACGVWSAA